MTAGFSLKGHANRITCQVMMCIGEFDPLNPLEDAEKVYESDRYVVMVPETKEASCYYGAGTKWCTAQTDRDYFTNYKERGELYYIIDKTKPTSDPFYKIA